MITKSVLSKISLSGTFLKMVTNTNPKMYITAAAITNQKPAPVSACLKYTFSRCPKKGPKNTTINNGLITAAKSGFTGIALHPNTQPITDNSGAIAYAKSKSLHSATQLFPIGSLTVKSKGTDLAELYDMHKHSAASFGDYKKPITNPNLLKLALQYTQSFDGLVQSYPQNNDIAGKGMVNEEISSTQLGLKGIPSLAEELQVSRDLCILEYTGGKLHIPTVSSAKSVALIKAAKKKGLDKVISQPGWNRLFLACGKFYAEKDVCYLALPLWCVYL